MKTEPTEKLREKANCLKYNVGVIHSNPQLILEESFISGVKYGQSSPKIKQPEWIEQQNGLLFVPHYLGITYCIVKNKSLYWVYCQFYNNYENTSVEIARTLDEAKLMVQADFEKRIKECLIIE